MSTVLAPPTRRVRPISSSVAKKQIMAVTGVVLILFVTAHMVGNLKFFTNEESFDHYAHWLRTVGEPLVGNSQLLWIQRVGLTIAISLHIWAATSLTLRSRRARPVDYKKASNVQATYAARTMRWGGVIILLFVIFHILDLTVGTVNPEFVSGHVYANTVATFQRVPVALFYIVAVGALAQHLYHGFWSMLQTLGANRPGLDRRLRQLSKLLALVIFIGFVSVPVSVLLGYGS